VVKPQEDEMSENRVFNLLLANKREVIVSVPCPMTDDEVNALITLIDEFQRPALTWQPPILEVIDPAVYYGEPEAEEE